VHRDLLITLYKLITRTQQTLITQTHQKKKGITFTYHSPLIHKIANLFKHTNINIAFRGTNTINKQKSDKITQNKVNSSGIYKLKCNTCNNSYVGQTGRSIGIRHKEHKRYIKNTCNNSYVGQPGKSIRIRHKEHTRYIKTTPATIHMLDRLVDR
jgi:transposase-like protein